MSNLLSNARNHGLVGQLIGVHVAENGGHAALSVSNQAPPSSAEKISSLFDPFKAASAGNNRNPGGLGLGLYIASEVALGHGGVLEYSHDGVRVKFTMTLPKFDQDGLASVSIGIV